MERQPSSERILVASPPEHDIAEAIEFVTHLARAGYTVAAATDVDLAVGIAQAVQVEVVILDARSVEAARLLLRRPATVILLVADAADLLDEDVARNMAEVDDFIVRPVHGSEVVSRVRVLLGSRGSRRRAIRGELEGPCGMIVRPQTREVLVGSDTIPLRPRELSVLQYLLQRRGEVVTIDTLLDEVWAHGPGTSRNLVEAQISRLRSKLRGTEVDDLITTVHGVGYLIR
jgi:DNA-binding response OmpR family regulator